MKLASLKTGDRDGALLVVSKDLSRAALVPQIVKTMQKAIENWVSIQPSLSKIYEQLNANTSSEAFDLDVSKLESPFPRSYQFLDGSVYLHHMEKARKARGAEMPPNYKTEPLMYQGLSDRFCGPEETMVFPEATLEPDYEAEVAIVVDDVPMGTTKTDAGKHIKLVMLLNDYTLRALTKTELPKGFGFLQAKPTSAFSPVAVTLDELGDVWDGEKLHLPLISGINGMRMGQPNTGQDMFFTYLDLIEHACRTRSLSAGTIIGAGSVTNQDEASGFGCVAEARIHEQMVHGKASTPFLKNGDEVYIEMLDDHGRSIFGAIRQKIKTV
ncbi:fumarylacetoacetate hydrolase family protein [Polynucleobacter sp. JS-JIR-II-b4]|uniref:fumarylacetoacetate hydrolase family protein n=1 Tax=Polynucleobacter sp. JS-JIR-II-b4 TaxID=1758390 RepID=UPI001BFDBA23|nr:fumarylacetoacetate hydrolase family protein [Polynucleobacter sp. JS-JIR-II-b4]QWE02189.1 fumarylacetoacetate hydrolase family protein [Polynucleobacter sp. JS-JIR-II-b4]